MTSSARAAFLAFSLLPALVAAEARRGVVPRDLLALETLSALEVSPDGATLVYGIERADAARDAYTHDLFLMPSGGGPARRIGKGPTDDTSPRFSADGRRLAWLSDDGEGAQIVVARKDGKGAKRVTSLAEGVLDFDWSPDGRTFVFTRTDPSPDGAARTVGDHPQAHPARRRGLSGRASHAPLGRARRRRRAAPDHERTLRRPRAPLLARRPPHRVRLQPHGGPGHQRRHGHLRGGAGRLGPAPGGEHARARRLAPLVPCLRPHRVSRGLSRERLVPDPAPHGRPRGGRPGARPDPGPRHLDGLRHRQHLHRIGGDLVTRRPAPLQDLRAARGQLPGPGPKRRLGPRARAARRGTSDRPGSPDAGGRPLVLRGGRRPRTCTRSTPCRSTR